MANISINIPQEQFVRLANYLARTDSLLDIDSVIGDAIDFYISGKATNVDRPNAAGYWWKDLFLPAGTMLRVETNTEETSVNSSVTITVSEDGRLFHNKKLTSPSKFLHMYRNTPRNAWLEVYILLPDHANYKLANDFRTK